MSYVFQVSDRPYFDYNLASHGRPNRFILTESSRVGDGEGGGERGMGGGARVGNLFCPPIISQKKKKKRILFHLKAQTCMVMLYDFLNDE